MEVLLNESHSTLPAQLHRMGLKDGVVWTFDAHLDTSVSPNQLQARIQTNIDREVGAMVDRSFSCGNFARPFNCTNVWTTAAVLGVVKKVVWVCPSASSRFAAKAHMIEVLLRQKYWCPIALLEFLQSGDEAISVEGFSIEAVPGKVDLARNQIADIDVLDLDMDFFYDPGSDSVNVQCLHTFDALGKKLHPRIFAISKSVADGYCPTAMCESRGAYSI